MSLKHLASKMAAHGRGPDNTLVHMSHGEVLGLQALAKAKGGSLTINPKTGLVEAGFLDDALSGVGNALSGGLGSTLLGGAGAMFGLDPMTMAMIGGGLGMAGGKGLGGALTGALGAYGGAGLGGALAGAGGSQAATDVASQMGVTDPNTVAQLTPEQIAKITEASQPSMANASLGAQAAAGHPIDFLKNNQGSMAAILGSSMLGGAQDPAAPSVSDLTKNQYIRPAKAYKDKNGNLQYNEQTPVLASNWGSSSFAGGGIIDNEPVRMATGGNTDALAKTPGSDSAAIYAYLMGTGPNPYANVAGPTAQTDPALTAPPPTPAAATPPPAGTTDNAQKGGNGSPATGNGSMSVGDVTGSIAAALGNTGIPGLVGISNVMASMNNPSYSNEGIHSTAPAPDQSAAETGRLAAQNAAADASTGAGPSANSGSTGPGDAGNGNTGGDNHGNEGTHGSMGGGNGDGGGGGDGGSSNCVDPSVCILMADGTEVPAGLLQFGDVVHTMHEDTLEYGDYTVLYADITMQPKHCTTFTDGQTIVASESHKFYMQDKSWKRVDELVVGDQVVTAPGINADGFKTVQSVEYAGVGNVVKLTIDQAHTYISAGLVSHNKAYGGLVDHFAAGGALQGRGNFFGPSGGFRFHGAQMNTTPTQAVAPTVNGSVHNVTPALPNNGSVHNVTPALPKMAGGGIADLHNSAQYHLGSYSDGGRLLKGPGDGVSDDIPATIGHNTPARLADGEFVIPARIVSEIGNGSTDAGAKRLYQMMARIQAGRKKTMGKDAVATDTKAVKHLPA